MSEIDGTTQIDAIPAIGAWDLLKTTPSALLIDVRTKAEWSYVGAPDLSAIHQTPVFIEWQSFPSMQIAGDFVAELGALLRERRAERGTPLLFLCRSGVRSLAAARAMTAAGFTQCFNITGGFEGPLNDSKRRGAVAGWKADNLPWVQS